MTALLLPGRRWRPDWSGRRSLSGTLTATDPITYDAATGVVTRHADGRSQPVDDDVFAVLEVELASGPADVLWVGYFGYAACTDLPARVGSGLPDAVWMRPSRVDVREERPIRSGAGPAARPQEVPGYAAAFDAVQGHLRTGNSYEVNLTYRLDVRSELSPVDATAASERSTRRRMRDSSGTTCRRRAPGC